MTSLGDRMKGYESAFDSVLPSRLPVVIRVDGKAFHTLTRRCDKPWDVRVEKAMECAALALCQEVQGACLGYVQSDEINVLVHGYRMLDSEPWFGGRIQKIAAVSAAIASVSFSSAWGSPAYFDARVFVLPEAEFTNYFLWRQRDAERNSIQSLAQSLASHRELDGLKNDELQELCFERGVNWNELPTYRKRGRCANREAYSAEDAERHRWVIDHEPPRFSSDRDYIESRFHKPPEPPA